MQPTEKDRAAVVQAVELLATKQAVTLKEIEAEFAFFHGMDKSKRTMVVASAMWLTTITTFASAFRDEDAFVRFMQGLMSDTDDLREHHRKAQKRKAKPRPGLGRVH